MLDFVIFAVTFLVALIIAIIWLYPSSRKVTTVPGLDPSSKEDGNLSDIRSCDGTLHGFLQNLHEEFGSISGFWWGKTYVVSIASPELFKEHENVFDKPSKLFEVYRPLIGSASILFANGSDGRTRRRHYEKAFTNEAFSSYCSYFQKVANSIERTWSAIGPEDHVPLKEHTSNYAFKSTLWTLLGEEFEDDTLASKMKASYEKVWLEIEQHFLDSVAPDENSPQGKQIRKAMTTINDMIKEVAGASRKKKGSQLIDILADVCSDETTLVSDAVTYFTEGFQPSWNTLSWAFYFLATHKEAQDKLFKEIKKILGNNGTVDESNYSKLKYMSQVIDETLRCAVVYPWAARVQDFDSVLGGHKIPKGTPVIQALGVVMQDDQIWPLPNKFDPDRFSDENMNDKVTLSFPAFGFAGKRTCPGSKFAYLEVAVLLATLIRRFEISLCNDQVIQPFHGLVTAPGEEIWIKVVKR